MSFDVYQLNRRAERLEGKAVGPVLALELIEKFMTVRFGGAARHRRLLAEVQALEHPEMLS